MPVSENYDVNFFKHGSKFFKAKRRLIVTLFIIWLVAVFGFQVLLIILQKPKTEAVYDSQLVMKFINSNAVSTEEKQKFSRLILSVLGKNIVLKPQHKQLLKETLSNTVYSLFSDKSKYVVNSSPLSKEVFKLAIDAIGLKPDEITTDIKGKKFYSFDKIMSEFLAVSLVNVSTERISEKNAKQLDAVLKLYLTHNQSGLTDFTFLGFPFHYFYTAIFLLVMFVLMCIIYSLWHDRAVKKFNINEDD